VMAIRREFPDFAVFMGPEEKLAWALRQGASGGVAGGANLAPDLYVALYEAGAAGDGQRAAALHRRVMAISRALYHVGRHASSYLKGVKCALACMGICDDFVAEPFRRFREPERALIRARLEKLGLTRGG